jgi:hypothetical protein
MDFCIEMFSYLVYCFLFFDPLLNSGNTRQFRQYHLPLGIDFIFRHSVWYHSILHLGLSHAIHVRSLSSGCLQSVTIISVSSQTAKSSVIIIEILPIKLLLQWLRKRWLYATISFASTAGRFDGAAMLASGGRNGSRQEINRSFSS